VRRTVLVAGLAAVAAGEPRTHAVEAFAADPERARRTVAACDPGRVHPDREAARAGLAQARRRERMAACETAF